MAALATALAAVTFWVLPAAPAYAGNYLMVMDGATVYFEADGDKVTLCDKAADGFHVELRVKNVTKDPDVLEYPLDVSGNNNCETVHGGMGQPYNLAEKHCFRFTMWLANGNDKLEDTVEWEQYRNYNNDWSLCNGVN